MRRASFRLSKKILPTSLSEETFDETSRITRDGAVLRIFGNSPRNSAISRRSPGVPMPFIQIAPEDLAASVVPLSASDWLSRIQPVNFIPLAKREISVEVNERNIKGTVTWNKTKESGTRKLRVVGRENFGRGLVKGGRGTGEKKEESEKATTPRETGLISKRSPRQSASVFRLIDVPSIFHPLLPLSASAIVPPALPTSSRRENSIFR